MSSSEGDNDRYFVACTPAELRIIPFVILMPSLVVVLVEPVWQVIVPVIGVLVLLVWAVFSARISVRVGADTVEATGPFYRRSIPVDEIDEVSFHREDASDHSLLKWAVVGKASSPAGVRLSLGGTLAAQILTTGGDTYKVFFASRDTADACVVAVAAAVDRRSLDT